MRSRHALVAPLIPRKTMPAVGKRSCRKSFDALDRLGTGDLAKILEHRRLELRSMAIGVDDRMREPASNLLGFGFCLGNCTHC